MSSLSSKVVQQYENRFRPASSLPTLTHCLHPIAASSKKVRGNLGGNHVAFKPEFYRRARLKARMEMTLKTPHRFISHSLPGPDSPAHRLSGKARSPGFFAATVAVYMSDCHCRQPTSLHHSFRTTYLSLATTFSWCARSPTPLQCFTKQPLFAPFRFGQRRSLPTATFRWKTTDSNQIPALWFFLSRLDCCCLFYFPNPQTKVFTQAPCSLKPFPFFSSFVSSNFILSKFDYALLFQVLTYICILIQKH